MGRGRGKGKKLSGNASTGSGEDFKLPLRRRGRPQKIVKDEFEEVENIEEEKSSVFSTKNQAATDDGKKRKRPSMVEENEDSMKEDQNGEGTENKATDLIKSIGYRQNGSRRKNKPRRAAEVGVECK